MVGLIPLFAVETLEPELLDRLPGFQETAGMVYHLPSRSDHQSGLHAQTGNGGAATAFDCRAGSGCVAS